MKHKKYNHKLTSTSEAVDVDNVIVNHKTHEILMKTHEVDKPSKMIELFEKGMTKRELAYMLWEFYKFINFLERK